MNVLACTGGIGSGKTFVCDIFSAIGIPVYNSDEMAKSLYDRDPDLLKKIVSLLGDDIIKNGVLQRQIMASKIFNNRDLLIEIEKIVHPAVLCDFSKWKEKILSDTQITEIPFVIFESAIVLEKPLVNVIADKILTVSAPLELRIERVMKRDNVSRERVLERISAQWDDNKREALADFIIFADCKKALMPQILEVTEAMRNL